MAKDLATAPATKASNAEGVGCLQKFRFSRSYITNLIDSSYPSRRLLHNSGGKESSRNIPENDSPSIHETGIPSLVPMPLPCILCLSYVFVHICPYLGPPGGVLILGILADVLDLLNLNWT